LIPFFVTSVTLAVPNPAESEARCQTIAKTYLRCGNATHPDFVVKDGVFHFVINGKKISIPCSDGIDRDFYDRENHMDISSILEIPYAQGEIPLPSSTDAGRLRSEVLLKSVYGSSENAVAQNLRSVKFLNAEVQFNKKNGAAHALEEVGKELAAALKQDPKFAQEMAEWKTTGNSYRDISRGTFKWRVVAGTPFLSVHSFGVAIDFIPVEQNLPEYWRWYLNTDLPEDQIHNFVPPARISIFPAQMIEIFERNGFVWGGKWWHFDSMHFEFRPEYFPDFMQKCEN
jgi:hypothetical protein